MIYVYRCTCGIVLEKSGQKIDSPLPKCNICEKEMVKVPAVSSFILKGSGWYKDGYQKKDIR